MALPCPLQTMLGQAKVYRAAQTTTLLGGRGEGGGGDRKAHRVNCAKTFAPHCSLGRHVIYVIFKKRASV